MFTGKLELTPMGGGCESIKVTHRFTDGLPTGGVGLYLSHSHRRSEWEELVQDADVHHDAPVA